MNLNAELEKMRDDLFKSAQRIIEKQNKDIDLSARVIDSQKNLIAILEHKIQLLEEILIQFTRSQT